MIRNKFNIVLAFIFIFTMMGVSTAKAATFPKTIDYPPMSEPNAYLGEPTPISTDTDLVVNQLG